jgi:U3 small nucleolar RNA-associated protein 19
MTAKKNVSSSVLSQLKKLEGQLTDGDSLNPLVELLDLTFNRQSPHETSKAIYSVYRVFVVVLTSGKWALTGVTDEKATVIRSWIWERLSDYSRFLTGLLRDEEGSLRVRNRLYSFAISLTI